MRLKLRTLLARKKAEQFAKSNNFVDKNDLVILEKLKEKNKLIERLKTSELENRISKEFN
jgi:hypothetical protein